ncbi:aminotransferase class I/II-fold pyridoxal phosphate-dependent enzyme [Acidaminobacterium chupaoyuni]
MRSFLAHRCENAENDASSLLYQKAAKYHDLIDLTVGDFDLPTPAAILEPAFEDAWKGHTKYTATRGDPLLCREIADYYRRMYQVSLEKEEILVTAAGCIGMTEVLLAVLNPGDEVIVPDPMFFIYPDQIRLAGGVPVCLPTSAEDGFSVDPHALEEKITTKTKAILLNTPNNPTGAVYSQETMERIGALCKKYDLLAICDDIYTGYVFGGQKFAPMITVPGMRERTVCVNSFSKNFVMTGMRVGNIVAPRELTRAVKHLNDFMMYTAPAISQRAAIYALRNAEEITKPIVDQFEQRLEYAWKRCCAIKGMQAHRPQGSIYLFPSIKQSGKSSLEACEALLEKAHVLLMPGNEFGQCGEGYVRIACTREISVLKAAFDRIEASHALE